MEDDEIRNAAVFRGRFKECLAHLFADIGSRAPKGTREVAALRRPIAEFCGVKESSVARWMRGDGEAIGEVGFRLTCYLQLIGYEVIEFVRSGPVVSGTIELIGFGIISGEEIAKAIGYSTASSLYHALNGHAGLSEEKENMLWGLAKKHRSALEETKKKAQATIKPAPTQQRSHELKSPPTTPDTAGQRQASKGVGSPSAGTSQGIIGVMGGLLILLESGVLTEDDCTALTPHEQRTILKLSGHLSRLSSNLVIPRIGRDGDL